MKKILTFTLITSSLFSLTLKEATQRGVSNAPIVKSAEYKIQSKSIDVGLSSSNYYPRLDARYIHTRRDKATASFEKNYNFFSIGASINLFNGLGDYFTKKSASDSLEVAKLEKSATISDLKLQIQQNYINHLNAKMEEQNQIASLDLLQEQYKSAQLQFEQGVIAVDDLLKVEVSMLNIENTLLKAKANVKTSWLMLKQSLGGELSTQEKILDPQIDSISSYQYNELKEKMYSSRSELKALQLRKSATLNQKETLEATYLPKADLSLTHNIYEKEKKSGGVVVQPKDETITQLTLSWNLYNGGKTTKGSEKLKYNVLMLEESVRDLKLSLEFQLESAFTDLNIAKQRLTVAKKGKESALKSYEATKEKYQEGVANNTQLLNAREDLTKATSDLNSAKYNLLLSNARLERVIGE